MIEKLSRNFQRQRRHLRIRKQLRGTAEQPRISVFRSLRQIYAQCVDDDKGRTLISASSSEKSFKENGKGSLKERAHEVGKILGERLKELGIKKVVFDRGGYKYHGKVGALADGMRETGLEF